MTIKDLQDANLIVYNTGVLTNYYRHEKSPEDPDIYGVYILPSEFILGGHGCSEYSQDGLQLSGDSIYKFIKEKTGDVVCLYYELRYFLKLLSQGSPVALQVLFAGRVNGQTVNSAVWDILYFVRKIFLTKKVKYSMGYYGLHILKCEHKQTKSELDFYNLISMTSTVVHTVSEHNELNPKCPIDTDHVQLTKIQGDLYEMWYSQGDHFYRRTQQGKLASRWLGMSLRNGKPIWAVISEAEKVNSGMNKIGLVYFNQTAWNNYSKIKPKQYTSQQRAKAYRYVKLAINIAQDKDITFPIKGLHIYNQILAQDDDLTPGGELMKTVETHFNEAFEKNTLIDCVDNENLNRLEVEMRKKFELFEFIEQ